MIKRIALYCDHWDWLTETLNTNGPWDLCLRAVQEHFELPTLCDQVWFTVHQRPGVNRVRLTIKGDDLAKG